MIKLPRARRKFVTALIVYPSLLITCHLIAIISIVYLYKQKFNIAALQARVNHLEQLWANSNTELFTLLRRVIYRDTYGKATPITTGAGVSEDTPAYSIVTASVDNITNYDTPFALSWIVSGNYTIIYPTEWSSWVSERPVHNLDIQLPTYSITYSDAASLRNSTYCEISCGWPFLAFHGFAQIKPTTGLQILYNRDFPYGVSYYSPSLIYIHRPQYYVQDRRYPIVIPLIPIWRGFLLNSLVYLCMIGFADLAILRPTWRNAGRPALRSLRSWRRRRRIIKHADRRGLCPNCKHPLVPAATDPATGTTSPRRCTECGWSDAPPPPSPQPTIAPSV